MAYVLLVGSNFYMALRS